MRFYNIEKDGIKNVIDEAQYESIYKAYGWKIVSDAVTGEIIKGSDIRAEEKIKNRNKVAKVKPQKFDDGIIKEDSENGDV